MRSYLIPRDVKGESRILYFFSPKSFLFTLIGIAFGTLIYFIFAKIFKAQVTGLIILLLVSLISFAIGALKIPETNIHQIFKDTGGESIDDIIWRYLKFVYQKSIFISRKR